MPRGGVEDTGSETAGGSSGSGGGGIGTPVLRSGRCIRPRKGVNSSSPSGAGGGRGRGLGLTGVLRGGGARSGWELAADLGVPSAGSDSLAARFSTGGRGRPARGPKSCRALRAAPSVGLLGAGAVGFGGDAEADRRRSNICGL